MSRRVATSQSMTAPSTPPLTSKRSSRLRAMPQACPTCAPRVARNLPLGASPLGDVPEPDPPVLTTTDEESGIGTKCDARDTSLMGLQRSQAEAVRYAPEANCVIEAARRQQLAIPAECRAEDKADVAPEP